MAARPSVFLTAAWRHLAIVNYEVEPALLEPRLPAGTELDVFDGRTLVSVVAFRFLETRVLGVGIPFHRDFDEVNLRFYVRRRGPEGWRRGVVFVREIVPRRFVSWVARTIYEEPYLTLPTRHEVALPAAPGWGRGHVEYGWRQAGTWNRLRLEVEGAPAEVAPTSEEAFVAEHYWGYTRRRDGTTHEYEVEHPRWRFWPATSALLEVKATPLYGVEFEAVLAGRPRSAFVADGSEVAVRRGVALA